MPCNLHLHISSPCYDTIRLLEQALSLARRGELRGAVLIGLGYGRDYRLGWSGVAKDDPLRTLGGLERMKQEAHRHADHLER